MSAAQNLNQDIKTDAAGNLYHPHPAINGLWVADAEQRMDFLPAYFTSAFMTFEGVTFNMARETMSGYSGGFWEYALTDTGLPFVYPAYRATGDALARCQVSNVFQDHSEQIHPVLAGIHNTMLVLLAMISKSEELGLSDDEEEAIYDLRLDLQDYGLQLGKQLGGEQDRAFYRLVN